MHILFYDPATPSSYDWNTLQTQGLGGTETTVVRIAHALKNHHQVSIAQHCRAGQDQTLCEGVNYLSLEAAQQLSPDVVILLRQYRLLESVGTQFPRARKFLWLHNMPSAALYDMRAILLKHQFQIIAVSHFHRRAIERRLRGRWFQRIFPSQKRRAVIPVRVLYNPIDEHLNPDQTAWKANQLFFMSSPQKGLAQTLESFKQLRRHFPEYQLLISNPGYNQAEVTLPEQARFLGTLPHAQVIQHLRESFCVFYPQQVRVETFGLVYAEANAVGTPVLAHDSGAASEVLSDSRQLVNGGEFSSILEKIQEWRAQRPLLQARPAFRLSQVVDTWLRLLQQA